MRTRAVGATATAHAASRATVLFSAPPFNQALTSTVDLRAAIIIGRDAYIARRGVVDLPWCVSALTRGRGLCSGCR